MFDPNAFLDMTVTDANSTVSIPVPVGEYVAVPTEVKARTWQSRDGSSSGIALDILWEVDDASVKEFLGRDKVIVKQGLMLDLTESGALDMGKGKNIQLGRLRESLDLNKPGEPFAFSMIVGRPAKVRVEHRVNDKNTDEVFAEVKGVAKLA